MCAGCGGSCGPPPPRFTRSPAPVDLTVIGTNLGPTVQPGHLVRHVGDTVAYETLYSGLTPQGQPASYVLPGTFARSFAAGRGR